MATEVKSQESKVVDGTKATATESTVTSTSQTPKKSNKTLWVVLGIVGVLLVCVISCVLLVVLVVVPSLKSSKVTTITDTPINTPSISVIASTDINDIIGQKDINDFFPLSFSEYNIRKIGIEEYMVGPLVDDYKKNGSTADDPVAQMNEGYYSLYGTEAATATEVIPEKTVRVVVYQFTDDQEIQDAIDITDGLFEEIPAGFDFVSIDFDDEVQYIAAYKAISSSEADSTSSGDARIFFPEDRFMIIISTARDFTLSEFQDLVKSYVDSFKLNDIDHVETSRILNKDVYETLNLD